MNYLPPIPTVLKQARFSTETAAARFYENVKALPVDHGVLLEHHTAKDGIVRPIVFWLDYP